MIGGGVGVADAEAPGAADAPGAPEARGAAEAPALAPPDEPTPCAPAADPAPEVVDEDELEHAASTKAAAASPTIDVALTVLLALECTRDCDMES